MIRPAVAVLLLTVALSGVGASAPAVGGHMLRNGHEACVTAAGQMFAVDWADGQPRVEQINCATWK